MHRIYKYPVMITDEQLIKNVPSNYKIMKAAFQGDQLCLWIMINTDDYLTTDICLHIYGTGHDIPDDISNLTYIDSVQSLSFVWHVFEKN